MNAHHITIRNLNRSISATAHLPKTEKYPLVIFSHGFNGSGEDFKLQAEALANNGIAALTFDFCGGSLKSKSDMQTYEMTVFTEKEDLFAVLNTVKAWPHVDNDSIFLFGGSMGGLVSALAAEERVDEIRGMILLYPAFCVADNWNERFPNVEDIPQIYELWEVPLGKCFFESLHGFRVFDVIGKYSGNVLIMHGDRDSIVPVEYSKRAQALYQNSHLEIFPGEGHGFSAVGNDMVTQMLMNFIISAVEQ